MNVRAEAGGSCSVGATGQGWLGVEELHSPGNKGCPSPLGSTSWAAKPASRGEPLKCREQNMRWVLQDSAYCSNGLLLTNCEKGSDRESDNPGADFDNTLQSVSVLEAE